MEKTTAEARNYTVVSVQQAKNICKEYLKEIELKNALDLGLPEIDDRYHIWRIALMDKTQKRIGEIVIDAKNSLIDSEKTSKLPAAKAAGVYVGLWLVGG